MKYLITITILVFCLTDCEKKPEIDSNQALKVKVAAAARREQPNETNGFGALSFFTKIDIASSQEGLVKKLYFREGDTVNEGEPAFQVENPQMKLAVERAQINYKHALAALDLARARMHEGEFQAEAQLLSIEKAEAELVRAKNNWEEERRKHQNQEVLYEAGGLHEEAIRASRFALQSGKDQIQILEKELEIRRVGCRDRDLLAAGIEIPGHETELRRALISLMTAGLRAELGAAQAGLDAAQKELASIQIACDELTPCSSASGVVGARYVEEGERIKAGDKIYTLMDTSSLYAVFSVREKDALCLEKGMNALVFIDGTGDTRKGTVDLVYPQADSQSLSFMVRVLINEGTDELKPGMFARVSITMSQPKIVLTIPESAVISKRGNEGTVFVLSGSTVSERKVTMGSLSGEEREITSGIDSGELIVLHPGIEVREGVYVSLAD
jgi:multidrug efflux pump subunit AcrA (membrane-fusion protein)